jgi:methyltransferase (TIGR00027 family)
MTPFRMPAATRRSVTAIAIGLVATTAVGGAQPGRPSVTALEVAAYRAIGAKHPEPAIRSDDRIAERLLGPEERAILKEAGAEVVLAALAMDTERAWDSLGNRSVFARGVHVRTRHIDEVLRESLKLGASQVVILGAGLDSRAYRFGDAMRGVRVFELDLPQTQAYKKKRVLEVMGELPAHVTYVPIDFAKQSLETVLDAAGYDRKKTALFIWEGVTMYLPEAAVDATLRAVVRNAAPGSRIVFDYFLESALQSRTSALREVAKNVAAVGEPFVFGIPGLDASAFVAARGFKVVSDFGSADLGARYLPQGRNLPTPSANRICTAAVP